VLLKRWVRAVQTVQEGDDVVLSWTPACGECAGCKRGQVHLCEAINMITGGHGPMTLGGQPLDRFMALGAFSEHVVVPERMAIAIHTDLPPAHSCLIGCGVTTGFGAAVLVLQLSRARALQARQQYMR